MTMARNVRLGILSSILILLSGCLYGGVEGDGNSEAAATNDNDVASTEQALFTNWSPASDSSKILGMGMKTNYHVFSWRNDGTACEGAIGSLCTFGSFAYSAGGDAANIVAAGIANNTQLAYAWYGDSTVSFGQPANLTSSRGKQIFTRPKNPNGVTFAMSDLIDVDCSTNGQWYYYWKFGTTVQRTIGDSVNASRYHGVQTVTFDSNRGFIVGIAIDKFATTYTWYSNGTVNNGDLLNLAVP